MRSCAPRLLARHPDNCARGDYRQRRRPNLRLKRPRTLEEALRDGERLLRRAAEDAIRMMSIGLRMSEKLKTNIAGAERSAPNGSFAGCDRSI